MARYAYERHVPYAPEHLFDVVADTASYANFLPNVSHMLVKPDSQGRPDIHYARMTIAFGPLTQSYTSRVTTDREHRIIRVEATDGPFARLVGVWTFEPEGEGTVVKFNIDFKFSNPLIGLMADTAFADKQVELVDAFMDEAGRRYAISG